MQETVLVTVSLAPDPTIGDLISVYARVQCTVLIEARHQLQLEAIGGNGDAAGPGTAAHDTAIHDTRVAARRLRSTLRTYAGVLDPARAKPLRTELAWFAGLLGDVRDLEVLAERLRAALDELPAAAIVGPAPTRIAAELSDRSAAAWDAVLPALDSERYRQLVAELTLWRDEPPLTDAGDAAGELAQEFVDRSTKQLSKALRSAFRARRRHRPDADHLLHEARKAGKRARYAVEVAAPVLGTTADEIIASRKSLQEILGEHQDSLVAAEFLHAAGTRVDADNKFTYGVLYQRELTRQAATIELLSPFSTH